ncbi:lysozyme inhibitor LprI family protein [Clostridium thailandense]|uniref:lysozyme inhibitor LprI family protein n=1 Tax=Clostridium thailandense TaxID=2794346 RepID=UPI003988C462
MIKKLSGILLLVLALGLMGCKSNVAKNVDTDSSKTKVEDKSKDNTDKVSKKQEYKIKLDTIGVELKKLDIKDSGTTADMREAANERYKKWDSALNEIYGVLRGELSSSDMKKLQNEEIQWISDRDAKAKKASSEMKGGTMESVIYVNSLADTTKQRCYELVEKYMK